MRRAAVTLVTLLTLAAPAPAGALNQLAPPGNSGVDQYLETIPAAGGNRPTPSLGAGNNPGALSPATRRRLLARGATGRALAGFTDSSAPSRAAAMPPAAAPGGNSALGAGLRALTDSGASGVGPLLPLALGLSLIGAVAYAIRRRRGDAL